MQQLVIIDLDTLNKLQESVNDLKQLVLSQTKTKQNGVKNNTADELENWCILKRAWGILNISKAQWYRTYQHKIKHRTYGAKTWVYLPSILAFLEENTIN